ncbi:MAG: hypothetical protein QM702_05175 [Rubrivivax sp.]
MSLRATDRRFPVAADAAASAAAACRPGSSAEACEPRPPELDRYVGDLAQAMWEVDLERRSLTRDALERSRLNSSFNALTWPAVSFAAAKKLRSPEWSPRDAVALGFAAFKFLGEGIPERDRIYLQTANRLACSLMGAEPYLYLAGPHAGGPDRGFALQQLSHTLEVALDLHESERARLLPKLVVQAPPGRTGRDSVHALRLETLRGAQGGGVRDPVTPFLQAIDKTFTEADGTLDKARQVTEEVVDAGTRLRHESSRIQSAMFAELQGRAPAPADPLAAARQVAEVLDQALAKGAASGTVPAKAQSRDTSSSTLPWEPTPARLKGFAPTAVRKVSDFWVDRETTLRAARRQTQDWLDQHRRRVAAYRAEATRLGCGQDYIDAFIANLAVRANQPASAPAAGKANNESALPGAGGTR